MSDVVPARLSVAIQAEGRMIQLGAVGEIDISTVDQLAECLNTALDKQPDTLTVDLAGVTLLDSTGIAALVRARNRATEQAVTLTVTSCQPIVRRVLDITGVLRVLTGGN